MSRTPIQFPTDMVYIRARCPECDHQWQPQVPTNTKELHCPKCDVVFDVELRMPDPLPDKS